jgi:acyl dehydratase
LQVFKSLISSKAPGKVKGAGIFSQLLHTRGNHMQTESEVWPRGIPKVGQKAQRSRLVTARDIELFTEISGDRNPLHYDEEVAKNTRFGGIVVQGGITSAILNAVVAEDLPGPGTVFLQVNWSFKAPVRPGDIITGEVEVTKVREDKPITELLTRVLLADGSVVLEGNAVCYTMPIR